MKNKRYNQERACGINKRENLLKSLRCCEFNTDSIQELRSCYSRTARQNGESARQCIAAKNFASDSFIQF